LDLSTALILAPSFLSKKVSERRSEDIPSLADLGRPIATLLGSGRILA
jgi:hypothetical protein